MNKLNYKQELKDALNWVKQTYLANPDELKEFFGICKAVEHYCEKVIKIHDEASYVVSDTLSQLIKTWPHCATYNFTDESGQFVRNHSFPVSTSAEWTQESKDGTIWKNLKRLELLEYLIQEVNKDE